MTDPRRTVPGTDTILADPRLTAMREQLHPAVLKRAVHAAQDAVRAGHLRPDGVVDAVLAAAPVRPCSLRSVLNATGVVVHTNLGRAPLSTRAREAIREAAGYVDVEYDVGNGTRARRGTAATTALCRTVPAAEDALVVNNGAAALALAAAALANDQEIIVSRGELVEIGDGFRIPELLAATGARLREVGSTNRTALSDYAAALGPQTGFVLKVHPSNFTVRGFVSSVSVSELAGLGVPVVADLGSGLLHSDPLLPDEPAAQSWLSAGANLVTASGDKLLGGPQAGLLLGRRDSVRRLRGHPFARALRVDKLTLAALEATLLDAADSPVRAALHADPDWLHRRASALVTDLAADGVPAEAVPSTGVVGGGGAPQARLPGWAIALPERFADMLRAGRPCVVTRIEAGRCLLDLRCVPADADEQLAEAVRACT
ncbi:L-seryl-tRNA(Sec) selenium transferase [Sciscionella sediminilitoris]|uniref:L-seryl-tRNA(Sec) selenium transferase n=1 Tax=Sciscionella sediminilitoris TaxID=1445613 RepID=UPI0004DF61CF|nr:L-seryl-tRNA(Sec) selenium transferase [Sciscionella sp. SE31]